MSVAIFRETRRDVQVTLGSEKLATIVACGARVRPASATTRHYAAHHGFHKWLDAGSAALHFVSACDNAADSDKTSGPPATRGLSHLASLSMCSSAESIKAGSEAQMVARYFFMLLVFKFVKHKSRFQCAEPPLCWDATISRPF